MCMVVNIITDVHAHLVVVVISCFTVIIHVIGLVHQACYCCYSCYVSQSCSFVLAKSLVLTVKTVHLRNPSEAELCTFFPVQGCWGFVLTLKPLNSKSLVLVILSRKIRQGTLCVRLLILYRVYLSPVYREQWKRKWKLL